LQIEIQKIYEEKQEIEKSKAVMLQKYQSISQSIKHAELVAKSAHQECEFGNT